MREQTSFSVAERIARSTDRLSVKSALNPILWLCGISLSVGVCAIIAGLVVFGKEYPIGLYQTAVLILILIPLILTGFGFIYILVKLPDMLQSEEFQLQKKSMELSQEKNGNQKRGGAKEEEDLSIDKTKEE